MDSQFLRHCQLRADIPAQAKEGDKMMLMLSEAGHKEATEALKKAEHDRGKQLAAEAAKVQQEHRDGTCSGVDPQAPQSSLVILEGEGVNEPGAFLVHVTRGKTRCTVAASAESTVTTSICICECVCLMLTHQILCVI